jgi:hypothetical protein
MSMHIVAGENTWLHGHKRVPISLEQIHTCTIVPGRTWQDAVAGCGVHTGQLVWLLEHGANGMDPERLLKHISGVAMWWMLVSYERELDEFCLGLVQHQCAPQEGMLSVILKPAQDPVQHLTSLPFDVDVIHSSLSMFLREHDHPTPDTVRHDVLERECPEGHTRVVFIVPKLAASFSLVAEVGGGE